MDVSKLGQMIESFIPGGRKYVQPIMEAIHQCPVNPSLWRLIEELPPSLGPLGPHEVIELVEVLESLVHRGYVTIEHYHNRVRLFALTNEGRRSLGVDYGRLNVYPEPDALHYSEFRDELPERQLGYPRSGEFISMEDPLRRPL